MKNIYYELSFIETTETGKEQITLTYEHKKDMLTDYINIICHHSGGNEYYSFCHHLGGVWRPYVTELKAFKNGKEITEQVNKFIYY